MELTPELAGQFASSTLSHLGRQFPYKADLVLGGAEDVRPPIEHHPIFHGSFDWHSCVHGWWQVLRIARLFPGLAVASDIRERANTMLTAKNSAGELAFAKRPLAAGFERPYGWAWLLALHSEAARHDAPWGHALEPLARHFAQGFKAFLPKLTYPLRAGVHSNIAFALILALEWANERDGELASLIRARARHWFADDQDCQAWEPSGDEFLSSALTEAMLMSDVLDAGEFAVWFGAFLPGATQSEPKTLFTPATVSDRSDGKIVHLDGLNLSRAWCWRAIAQALPAGHAVVAIGQTTARQHIEASLPAISEDYMGEHWLASFALLALTG